MATADENHPHENAFHGFDESVAHLLGADMRLVYGMAAARSRSSLSGSDGCRDDPSSPGER